MDLGIRNKVAIITGASSGIGKAVAREFSENGARVVLTARSEDTLATTVDEIASATGNSDIIGIPADVAADGTADTLVNGALERFGSVDIVVNNAGRAHAGGLLETTVADWEGMEQVKLHAMLRLNRTAIPHMQKNKWGRIVNMSSIGGIYSNPKLLISHVLSAAINNLTKGLALEVASDGIIVNAIAIGAVQTDNWASNMLPSVRKQRPEWDNKSDDEVIALLGSELTPVGQFGQPEDIAAAAAFLVSDRNRFVTGCTIEASGGADRFM